jgi:UDP-glucose 4-epimerase
MTFKEFSSKSVLVTGGASFIGSHLVESLVESGATVKVVDDLSSGKMENLAKVSHLINFIRGDLRNQEIAMEATAKCDVVFHLANIHGGRGFIETHPAEISQNLLIDGNIFYSAWKNKVKSVCYASSACVYPVNLQTQEGAKVNRYLEETMANSHVVGAAAADGVYGWGKLMGEMALQSYHEQFGMKGVSCRLFTVYGPRENESHAIIAFIARALLKQDPYEIWGTGNQDRNFTYVDDVVEGMMRASLTISDCSAINIGTREITTIIDAVKKVCRIVDFHPTKFNFDLSKPEGVSARAASTEKSLEVLGWEPTTSFNVGIETTIDWYRNHIDVPELSKNFEEKLMER